MPKENLTFKEVININEIRNLEALKNKEKSLLANTVVQEFKSCNDCFDVGKNQETIEGYYKEHKLGPYWKGTPTKIVNHYTQSEIQEKVNLSPRYVVERAN